MKKSIKLAVFIGFAGVSGMLLSGKDVNAYIDPSVATYLIQAIAGVVIAVGAAVGIYFRRARKKINDRLGIDENHNKEVETDEIIVDNKK